MAAERRVLEPALLEAESVVDGRWKLEFEIWSFCETIVTDSDQDDDRNRNGDEPHYGIVHP